MSDLILNDLLKDFDCYLIKAQLIDYTIDKAYVGFITVNSHYYRPLECLQEKAFLTCIHIPSMCILTFAELQEKLLEFEKHEKLSNLEKEKLNLQNKIKSIDSDISNLLKGPNNE